MLLDRQLGLYLEKGRIEKMQEKIEEIKKQAEERIKEIKDSKELQDLKVKVLGKKSELSNLLKSLGNLSPEERPKI